MNRTARRLSLAAVGVGFAALAAFATAGPAAADNGPHQLLSGSMVSNADGCAGCHRIHGGQTANTFLKSATEGAEFCYTCHAGGTGATTNVRDGVSTLNSGLSDTNAMSTHTTSYLNAALRGGGFESSRIGASAAVQANIYGSSARPNKYAATANSGIHPDANGAFVWGDLIPAGESHTTQSNHTVDVATTMWGSGTASGNAGASVTLECVNCHNPHGNGNYRILRPYGFEGDSGLLASGNIRNVTKEFNTVTAWTAAVLESTTATTPVGYNDGKYMYTVTTSETPTFVAGQPFIVRGAGLTPTDTFTGTVYSVNAAAKTMVVGNSSQNRASFSGTAYAMGNFPSTIIKAESVTATSYKFTTASAMNLVTGETITISTVSGAASYLAVKQAVVTALTTTTFTITVQGTPAVAGLEAGLFIDGIPDAKNVSDTTTAGTLSTNPGIPVGSAGRGTGKVYTTANYFLADDMYYSGTYNNVAGLSTVTSTPFIASVSQWCSTCHTRYLSDNRYMNSGDTFYTYKHRSNSGSQGSPNCIQCHVAHGSSAQASGAQSAALLNPGGVVAEGSVLLRVDNRGICLMCHNPYGVS